jgi:hypothetical protein
MRRIYMVDGGAARQGFFAAASGARLLVNGK